ncbi:MAG: HAMP domain-containing sensor histidine kinase [Cyanobacteria bacterium J06621_8]
MNRKEFYPDTPHNDRESAHHLDIEPPKSLNQAVAQDVSASKVDQHSQSLEDSPILGEHCPWDVPSSHGGAISDLRLLWSLYENNPAAICGVEVTPGQEYRYLNFNAACQRWLGLATSHPRLLSEVFSAAETKWIKGFYDQCVDSRSSLTYEECIVEPGGGSSWLTTLQPLLNQHGEVYLLISTSINLQQYSLTKVGQSIQGSREQLQQALKSKELVSKITKAIRDSLDETQILQTATASLTTGLNIDCCQIELYKHQHTITEVLYEYPLATNNQLLIQRQVADFPQIYDQLLAKNPLQFVDLHPTIAQRRQRIARLACPIFDDSGILGNLWLLRPKENFFEPWEIQLVQQIADQCAIAIRQARLYQAKRTQVKELEKLNLVKDDFLKTISHELRTPMSSIRLAISTLENLLHDEIGAAKSPIIDKVMNIFHASFKRQNQLVDDLLTLCYVDVASKPEVWQSIDLSAWITQTVKTYSIPHQQQQPQLKLDSNLPLLNTDPKMLQRVVRELLNNAYKYSPAEGKITINTAQNPQSLLLSISNSGIEIPPQEQERIFDKFYRIPNHDPWKRGGTGIGLALVKKLVELLEGTITVSSASQITTFVIAFPLK